LPDWISRRAFVLFALHTPALSGISVVVVDSVPIALRNDHRHGRSGKLVCRGP
jgi:hypothetical protein